MQSLGGLVKRRGSVGENTTKAAVWGAGTSVAGAATQLPHCWERGPRDNVAQKHQVPIPGLVHRK